MEWLFVTTTWCDMKIHFWLKSWNKTMCGRDTGLGYTINERNFTTDDIKKVTCKSCKRKADRLIMGVFGKQ